jgi:tRNA threonylcarbamoyladenosine biosynthesis protein TsaB
VNLLALDTSTEYLSLAILKGDKIFTFDALAGQSHSQIVLPQLQALLAKAQLSLQDLNGIAFGAGPGSFTGVRIAAGVAQGLGFGTNIPVLGVCTLQVLAEASGAPRVIACLDARMGEVYHAAYIKENNRWQAELAPNLYKPEAVPLVNGGDWVGAGSGWKTYNDALTYIYNANIKTTQPDALPTASAMLSIASPLFVAGLGLPASEALPIYIRNRVALKSSERALGERL